MSGLIDSARQKAEQLKFEIDKRNRVSQVQRQIDDLSRQNAADVTQIGTKVLDLHRQGQIPIADVTGLCQEIIEREAQITEFQAKITAIQQEIMPQSRITLVPPPVAPQPAFAVACPTCQTQVAAGALFCPNCGQPMAVEPASRLGEPCPNCGLPTVSDAAFCGECGFHLVTDPVPVPIVPVPEARVVDQLMGERPQPGAPLPISLQEPIEPLLPIDVVAGASISPQAILSADEVALPICPTCSAQQRRADAHFCFVCGHNMTGANTVSQPEAAGLADDQPSQPEATE